MSQILKIVRKTKSLHHTVQNTLWRFFSKFGTIVSSVCSTPRRWWWWSRQWDAHRSTPQRYFQSLEPSTPWCDAHRRDYLCGRMHTAEMISAVCNCMIPQRPLRDRMSRRNRNGIWKYFSLFIRGPDGFESWKKLEVENLATHSLLNLKRFTNPGDKKS